MNKIKIGKNIKFFWTITYNGEVIDLTEHSVEVEILTPKRTKVIINPTIEEQNKLVFSFKGKTVGAHYISCYIDRFTDGETSCDHKEPFYLVEKSWMEEDCKCGDLQTEFISLDGNIEGGVPGPRGPKGDKGDKMTYSDLTPEDKEDLLKDTYTKAEVNSLIDEEKGNRESADEELYSAISELAGNVYTKTESDNKYPDFAYVDGKISTLDDNKADKNDVYSKNDIYTKTETENILASYPTTAYMNEKLADKANTADVDNKFSLYYSKEETDSKYAQKYVENAITTIETDINSLSTAVDLLNSNKQNTLVSGTNIKTINGNDILGEGNIEIQGGGNYIMLTQAEYDALETKEEGVIYVITDAVDWQEKLTAGDNITIDENNVISAAGGELPGWLNDDNVYYHEVGDNSSGLLLKSGNARISLEYGVQGEDNINLSASHVKVNNEDIQPKLIAGDNITIENNRISAAVGGYHGVLDNVDLSSPSTRLLDGYYYVSNNCPNLPEKAHGITETGDKVLIQYGANDRAYKPGVQILYFKNNDFGTGYYMRTYYDLYYNQETPYMIFSAWKDMTPPDISDYYTKDETNNLLVSKANIDDVYNKDSIYTKDETNNLLSSKQDILIPGTNITIENNVISAVSGPSFGYKGTVESIHTILEPGWYYFHKITGEVYTDLPEEANGDIVVVVYPTTSSFAATKQVLYCSTGVWTRGLFSVSDDNIVFNDWIRLDNNDIYTKDEVNKLITPNTPNVVKYGNLRIENGIMDNFFSTNYAEFPFVVDLTEKKWTIEMEITTANDVTSQGNILDSNKGLAFAIRNGQFVLAYSNDGQSWQGEYTGGTVNANTTYKIKLNYDNNFGRIQVLYKPSHFNDYDTAIEADVVVNPYPTKMIIGKDTTNSYIYDGSINLNECKLIVNDQIIWAGMADAGVFTRLETDLANIDPDGVKYINGLIDNKIGDIDTALTNIIGA